MSKDDTQKLLLEYALASRDQNKVIETIVQQLKRDIGEVRRVVLIAQNGGLSLRDSAEQSRGDVQHLKEALDALAATVDRLGRLLESDSALRPIILQALGRIGTRDAVALIESIERSPDATPTDRAFAVQARRDARARSTGRESGR